MRNTCTVITSFPYGSRNTRDHWVLQLKVLDGGVKQNRIGDGPNLIKSGRGTSFNIWTTPGDPSQSWSQAARYYSREKNYSDGPGLW